MMAKPNPFLVGKKPNPFLTKKPNPFLSPKPKQKKLKKLSVEDQLAKARAAKEVKRIQSEKDKMEEVKRNLKEHTKLYEKALNEESKLYWRLDKIKNADTDRYRQIHQEWRRAWIVLDRAYNLLTSTMAMARKLNCVDK